MKKSICTGLVLLIIGASTLTIMAAESQGETESAAEKNPVASVNYEELAGIFKKYNGKHAYTVEQIKTLKRASLSQTKLNDEDFKKLSCLDSILLWNLGRCHALTRDSIPVLKTLTSARAIDLADTKLFKDYDEIVDTFKDYKNLEFLSVHLVGKEPTENYKEFLKARPRLTALVGVYSQKVEGGYRLKHKEALHALCKKWLEDGVITQEEAKYIK